MNQTTPPPVASILRPDIKKMVGLARTLRRLALAHPHPLPDAPETARFDPGHEAVMMGYDFHLTPDGPRLIEVNTNAGGLLMAHETRHPDFAAREPSGTRNDRRLKRLIDTFRAEMGLFSGDGGRVPRLMAILDDNPAAQFLYPEMVVAARLLEAAGLPCRIVDPGQLDFGADGVFLAGQRVELIYNRHCDFYLESPALAGLRSAWLNRQLCLTPNPRAYGLLADKRRMIGWSDPDHLSALGCSEADSARITALVPRTRLLGSLDPEMVWKERARWVFKPGFGGFGGRGVLIGEKISRARFATLDPSTTLVQRHIPPALIPVAGASPLKTDVRLFMYRDQLLGVGVRAYRGQVTNFREPGNGFLLVRID
ncbi:MAG: hypothetical protein HQL97_13100 [Magnetococcales bacterium]|nr:hypothetical protein [Magnetococcales bacterium]MBF0262758.1 hypothetical protein [Magnetococcales bacterium]